MKKHSLMFQFQSSFYSCFEMPSEVSLKFAKRLIGILKVLGFSYASIEDGKSVLRPRGIFRFIGSLVAGLIYVTIAIVYRESMMKSTSPIASFGNYATFIASMIVVLISQVTNFMMRHNLWELSQTLAYTEDKVSLPCTLKFL